MAEQVLTDVRVVVADFELNSQLTGAVLSYGAEQLDATKFGADTRGVALGLKVATLAVNGHSDAVLENADQFAQIGSAAVPFTVSQGNASPVVDSIGYLGEAPYQDYQPLDGTVGDLQAFAATLQANDLASGRITHDAQITSTSQGTVFQLGSLASARHRIIMACHVLTVASGTVRFDLRSDDNVGMSSPTVRASSQVFSAVGSELVTVNGPITDDYWQVVATVGGGSPDVTVVASMGIVTP